VTSRADEEPIRPRALHLPDVAVLVASALASLGLMWVIFAQFLPLSGGFGFALCWYLGFIAIYGTVVAQVDGTVVAADRVAGVVITSAAIAILVPLVLIVAFVLGKGIGALTANFFTQTQEFIGPLSAATEGGALHAIVGTFQQIGLAMLISVPLGLLTAVFLNEVGGPFARPVRMFVDAMSGVPSIVAGLFIYAIWVVGAGQGFSGLAAAFALSILMLPTVTRTVEEVLRLVPDGLREASLALGSKQWRTTWSVVLPTARSGLVTAVILGVARAIGETAPLIMTSFGASLLNANPLQGAQSSLPLFVYSQIRSFKASQITRAYTGALVLIFLVLGLFMIARLIGSSVGRAARRHRR